MPSRPSLHAVHLIGDSMGSQSPTPRPVGGVSWALKLGECPRKQGCMRECPTRCLLRHLGPGLRSVDAPQDTSRPKGTRDSCSWSGGLQHMSFTPPNILVHEMSS